MTSVDHSWFRANDKQIAFLSCVEREACYAGGVGAGKTLAGGFKALMACQQHPGTVGLIGRQSYRALQDTTKRVMVDGDDKPPIIPPQLIKNRSEGDNRVDLVNGSSIIFRAFQDFNMSKLRSLNLGWFWLDEATEATEDIWLELLLRLRHPQGPGRAWATTNPNGHDWVWRRFHPDGGDSHGAMYIATTEENARNLPADYIPSLRSSMPREWQKRFLDASFETAAGQIWDEWDRNVHVVPEFDIPYQWVPVDALDHGRRNPTAYLQARTDFDGNIVVTDGYYESGLVSQHATAITKLRLSHLDFGVIIADPSCWAGGADGRNVARMYAELGLQLKQASNNVESGLLRVSEWLTRRPGETFPDWHPFASTLGPDGLGAPRMFVMDVLGTADLRREIPDYRWRDLSPAMEAALDSPEEPRKKDDHACDALRYLVMSQPRPARAKTPATHDPERERRKRQISAGIRDMHF